MQLHFASSNDSLSTIPISGAPQNKPTFAILTTHIDGDHAPSADNFITRAQQLQEEGGLDFRIIYPEMFDEFTMRRDILNSTLTVDGKTHEFEDLPFMAVLPVVGAKQQDDHSLQVTRHFQSLGLPVLNPADAIEDADDKLRFYQKLKTHGFAHLPITFDLAEPLTEEKLEQLTNEVVVKKAQGSSGGSDVFFIDKSELPAYQKPGYLVQECLNFEEEDGQKTDYRYIVINGNAELAVKNTAGVGKKHTNTKQGANKTPVDIEPAMAAVAEEATRILGLGWAGVDIGKTTDGNIYVIEVNPTPSMAYKTFANFDKVKGQLYTKILEFVSALANMFPKDLGQEERRSA